MSDLRTSRLYELYCRFTEELNKAVRASGTRVSDVKATSYSEFHGGLEFAVGAASKVVATPVRSRFRGHC